MGLAIEALSRQPNLNRARKVIGLPETSPILGWSQTNQIGGVTFYEVFTPAYNQEWVETRGGKLHYSPLTKRWESRFPYDETEMGIINVRADNVSQFPTPTSSH